jgi:sugar lactone lactonase YvrE
MSRLFSSRFLHGLAKAAAVVGLASTIVFVSSPSMASAPTVPLTGSTFSISNPGSLTGTSGQAITPVQFVASNVDVSTGRASTSVRWVAAQLPAGLALSATGLLSGTLSASIPGGVYDLRIIATERVTTMSRGSRSVTSITADFATQISISGPSVIFSNPTVIGSGFTYPFDMAVDTSGHIFTTQSSNNRIIRMNTDGSNQTIIDSGFNGPTGVAVDTFGHIFVADRMNNRIVKMASDGSNPTVIGSGFNLPTRVAIDASGHIFVADSMTTGNGRIVKMNADGSNPTVIGSGFNRPYGVAVDTSGRVFVADYGNNRIVRMNTDGSNQTVIGSGFSCSYGVAVDTSGHVFVADTCNFRVVRMNSDGSNQTTIGSGFSFPSGVAVDTSGRVFVADSNNNRVVVLNGGFSIPDQPIPSVQAGRPLVATQLVSAFIDPSTSPAVTSVSWFASSLPAGLKLSSSGVLSGTPKVALAAGNYSIYVSAIEQVTTKVGEVTTVTSKTTSRVIPIVIT